LCKWRMGVPRLPHHPKLPQSPRTQTDENICICRVNNGRNAPYFTLYWGWQVIHEWKMSEIKLERLDGHSTYMHSVSLYSTLLLGGCWLVVVGVVTMLRYGTRRERVLKKIKG